MDFLTVALSRSRGGGSGLPDPSTLNDGTAMVAVDGEWKMQDGYGWTEEGSITTITWDGDTEGKVVFDDTFFKVSDLTPSKDSMSDAKIVFKGVEYDFNAVDIEGANGYYDSNGLVTVFLDDSETPKGIYFAGGDEDGFVSSLAYNTPDTVHKIDEKYLPNVGSMVVNVTVNEEDMSATADKTVTEIIEAVRIGIYPVANLIMSGSIMFSAPFAAADSESVSFGVAGIVGGAIVYSIIGVNNGIGDEWRLNVE